jgi:ABC-type branched-subunit amino acid transport system substrate-binding protein
VHFLRSKPRFASCSATRNDAAAHLEKKELVRNRRSQAVFVVTVVVVMLAAACGRSSSNTAATTGGAPSPSTAAPASPGSFGDLKDVCGPAPSGAKLAASDTGVTATSIQVSAFSDPGYSGRPGLDQELFDSADAFTKWCNNAGGISGRKIILKKRDAKVLEFQQRVIEACDQHDFMMVGGGAVFDNTGQTNRLACGLPTVAGFTVNASASAADLTYEAVPNPTNKLSIGQLRYLNDHFPAATKKIGVLAGSVPVTISVANRDKEALKDLGWKVVYNAQYNSVGEPTWRPYAEAIKNAGVKGLIWVGDPGILGSVMKALSDIGYKLDFVSADPNHYDSLLLTNGGSSVDGTYIRGVFYPFLDEAEAKKNPATEQYRAIVKQYVPKGKIAYLGAQGFSAWLLWAQAATACGADVTRDCVWQQLSHVTTWTGGGLHAPQNVAAHAPGDCYSLEQVKNGKFVLTDINANQGIYRCDPSSVVSLKGNYGQGEKCPNPKFATDPKPSNCAMH